MMEYHKIINLLENTPDQPSKFRSKNWVEINDDWRGICNTISQIKFKTSILESSLCDYSDAYILVNEEEQLQEQKMTRQYVERMKKIKR